MLHCVYMQCVNIVSRSILIIDTSVGLKSYLKSWSQFIMIVNRIAIIIVFYRTSVCDERIVMYTNVIYTYKSVPNRGLVSWCSDQIELKSSYSISTFFQYVCYRSKRTMGSWRIASSDIISTVALRYQRSTNCWKTHYVVSKT